MGDHLNPIRMVAPLEVDPDPNKPAHLCRLTGCSRPSSVRGLCGADYERVRRLGRLIELALPARPKDPRLQPRPITVTRCVSCTKRVVYARGVCCVCYKAILRGAISDVRLPSSHRLYVDPEFA